MNFHLSSVAGGMLALGLSAGAHSTAGGDLRLLAATSALQCVHLAALHEDFL